MSQQVDALKAQNETLKTAAASLKSVADTLKGKLDAAVADNVAKASQITDLQAQLAAAQQNQADPTDAAAIEAVTADLAMTSQMLADAAAVDAPSN